MNQISLKQSELVAQFGEVGNLASIIEFYEKKFEAKGEVICRVSLNNLDLSEADEAKFGQITITDIQSLSIATENTGKLTHGIVNDWIANLPELIKSADQVAQQIRLKGFSNSLTSFAQIIDACQLLVSSLSALKSVLLQSQSIDLQQWEMAESKLKTSFDQVMEACQMNNETELADIIEYDLADSLTDWQRVLSKVYADK